MQLSDRQIEDLMATTLDHLGRARFNQIAQELTDYEVMPRILKKDRVGFSGGVGIKRTFMTDHSSAARHVGMYAQDSANVGDVLKTTLIPWKHTTTNWSWERRELLMNAGKNRIVELMKVRRADGMLSLVELMEDTWWSAPGATDADTPFGIFYWLVKYPAATTTGGFYGANHANFSAGPGGLDANANPKWRNYTEKYTAATKPDLIKKMRIAHRAIGFKSPIDVPDFRKGKGQKYRIYVNNDTITEMEDIGESQNENLGRDLASVSGRRLDYIDGTLVFRNNPIIPIPKLDADADDPVIMLNYGWFQPVFLIGDYLRQTRPEKSPLSHNTFTVHVDLTWNSLCTNRRMNAVLSKGRTTHGSAVIS